MRKILILTLAAVLLLMSVPAASAKSSARPFKGTVTGELLFVPVTDGSCTNPPLRTISEAIGNVTHLGRTEILGGHCTPAGAKAEGGQMTMFAANGDRVFLEYEGTATPPNEDGILTVNGSFQIIGGTGRFLGAEGGGDMTVFAVFEGFEDFEWPATWVFNGRIGY